MNTEADTSTDKEEIPPNVFVTWDWQEFDRRRKRRIDKYRGWRQEPGGRTHQELSPEFYRFESIANHLNSVSLRKGVEKNVYQNS